MKSIFAAATLLVLLDPGLSVAQLSGSYTVGGASPDFATPQEAADSLMVVGVSGPVEILIRPGVYEGGTDGDGPALFIDREIVGSDAVNRVAFRADASAGGDTTNVILQRRVGGTVVSISTTFGQRGMSYITLEGFAVLVNDSVAAINTLDAVIDLAGQDRGKQLTDFQIIGLRIDGGNRRARWGIFARRCAEDVVFEKNVIANVVRAVDIDCGFAHRFLFRDNHISRVGISGDGRLNVARIGLNNAAGPSVSHNTVDMTAACATWAFTIGAAGNQPMSSARIEGNHVINFTCGNGGNLKGEGTGLEISGYDRDSYIVNNMVSVGTPNGGLGLHVWIPPDSGAVVAHNTVNAFGNTRGVLLRYGNPSGSIDLLNNIFVSESNSALEFSGTGPLNRDYNILSNGANIGPNSRIATPEFVDPPRDLHLGECALADSSLRGLGLPKVPIDFDSESRDPLIPFIGADEPLGAPPQVFAGPTVFDSGTISFLMASGDLDGDGDTDLAVTNVEAAGGSNDVALLWNDGLGTFSDPVHLPFGDDPTHIAIGHLNTDDFVDIVVNAAGGVYQRFGIAGGGFLDPVLVQTYNDCCADLELADFDNDGDVDIFVVKSVFTDSGRVFVSINDGLGNYTFNDVWTIGKFADDLELADIDQDGFLDLLVVDNTQSQQLYTLRNRGITGVFAGFESPVAYPLLVASVPTASRFVVGDFDGDSDPDLILGDAVADSLILVRNNGDGTLGPREPFGVEGQGAPRVVTKLDYEGDGDLDLVVARESATVDLMLNDGSGTFSRFALCRNGELTGKPDAILAARLDEDSSTDVAVLTVNDTVEILNNLMWTSPISNEEPRELPADASRLFPNYPNPFSALTTVRYTLVETSPVQLMVFDLLGRRVATVLDEIQAAGDHKLQVDATGLASGVYLYRISAGHFVETRRMVVVR